MIDDFKVVARSERAFQGFSLPTAREALAKAKELATSDAASVVIHDWNGRQYSIVDFETAFSAKRPRHR
jgi:hypothetical protein